jgi:hypothetical protein
MSSELCSILNIGGDNFKDRVSGVSSGEYQVSVFSTLRPVLITEYKVVSAGESRHM